jgi:hypothetical protein
MRRLADSVLLTLALSLAFAPAARAAGKGAHEDANEEAKVRAARKACLSGNYKKGVEILSDLFVTTEDPVFIYNQGRCFEQSGRCEEAINRFREYLRKAKKTSVDAKADAEKHIADCKVLMKETSSGDAPGPKPETVTEKVEAPKPEQVVLIATKPEPKPELTTPLPPKPESTVATSGGPSVGTTQVVTSTAHEPAQTSSPGRGLRIAGITCGAVGVASIATGVYFYTRARSYSDKVSNQFDPAPSDDSAGKNAETMQWVFYGIGGAAIATGTVLYILGWKEADSRRPRASVAPLLAPGLAGISAQGTF